MKNHVIENLKRQKHLINLFIVYILKNYITHHYEYINYDSFL